MSTQFDQLVAEIAALYRGDDAADNLEQIAGSFVNKKLAECGASGTEQQQALLVSTIDASLNDQVASPVSLAVIKEVISIVDANEHHLDSESQQKVLRHFLGRIQQRPTAFENVIISARLALSNVLVAQMGWEEAAQELREIRSEQLQRSAPAELRFTVYVRIMEYFERAGNLDQAVLALNRAASVVPTVKDIGQIIWYRRVQARIYERTHRYIEAANTYRNISQSDLKSADEQREMLDRAVRCVVLAAAGPQKMRVMAGLHREKLVASLQSFSLLENMVLKRLIRPAELDEFSARARLSPATMETLVRAVREHNVFVLSSLYTNMKFENLGRSLGIGAEEAEETCANMIAEGRMKGRIDQVDGVVTFEGSHEVEEVAAAISMKRQASAQPPPMHFRETVAAKWDLRIVNLCQAIEDSVDLLIERQPAYAQTLFKSMEQGRG
ncbi:hypothetical protein LPJ53_003468 [Coemansia erecta]|uniref:COP9 signalosome complex subunit 4 n=1 Tax=Coemansia erecta TaxID=147472 RepID=A0A9W7XW83_9FUNG|nr:hypothetical protein LPJ53_003468 [Coemansia erecta]